jgi:carbonic anhydrase
LQRRNRIHTIELTIMAARQHSFQQARTYRREALFHQEQYPMKTIDYVYRFEPNNPRLKPAPPDAETARKMLENGNRVFAQWMDSCRNCGDSHHDLQFIVNSNALPNGVQTAAGGLPKQAPFAIVVGCSDARVPMEMLFGQGFNDLFVVRVAGNVLGDVCVGSVEYALHALSESVKCVVILGHMGCGAVTGAVDCYLRPDQFWAQAMSPMLRSVIYPIFVAVRESDNAIKQVWGPGARSQPGYRQALIDVAVCVNAAHAAFDLRHEVERAGKTNIKVLYGVFSLRNHQVSMPVDPWASVGDDQVNLAHAPTNPQDFSALAIQMAEQLKAEPVGDSSDSQRASLDTVQKPARVETRRESDSHIGMEMPFRPL